MYKKKSQGQLSLFPQDTSPRAQTLYLQKPKDFEGLISGFKQIRASETLHRIQKTHCEIFKLFSRNYLEWMDTGKKRRGFWKNIIDKLKTGTS